MSLLQVSPSVDNSLQASDKKAANASLENRLKKDEYSRSRNTVSGAGITDLESSLPPKLTEKSRCAPEESHKKHFKCHVGQLFLSLFPYRIECFR